MILLALDIGKVRIGIAKSDALGMFAHPLGYIERKTDDEVMNHIKALIAEHTVDKIIIGHPIHLDGTRGSAALESEAFADTVKDALKIPVLLWDERLSTKEATHYLKQTAVSQKKKRKKIDSLAAQIILQHYLDSTRGSEGT